MCFFFSHGIGLATNQSSFLPPTAVPNQSISRHKHSLCFFFFRRSWVFFLTDCNGFRTIYSPLVMHRRTDLWGPDGISSQLQNSWLARLTHTPSLSSPRIWSWSLPRWKSEEIFNSEPLHFLSFQRRTSHLSGTTGITDFLVNKYQKLIYLFPVRLSWSHILPYSLIPIIHWVHLRQLFKP